MSLQLEANYSKKLGLPGFSSHQFSITIRSEITDLSQVKAESDRLYKLLQESVDSSIKAVGYLPQSQEQPQHNGDSRSFSQSNGNPRQNGSQPSNWQHRRNGYLNHQSSPRNNNGYDEWKCSLKQKELILNIVSENKLDKRDVEQLCQQLFAKSVRLLNKLEASGLIDELLRKYSNNDQPTTNGAKQ